MIKVNHKTTMDKIAQLYSLFLSSARVSTDTRTIADGDLFLP
ncbi:hypothetical protein ADICYQ_1498 [Cyclobacterium qasimii M12-11B]|uniref:Uncharacterized protein n=1 Tax=Cyclobacterium qasimii M12-11B TaxID=641524 RepID=S7VHD6_9BACT|nr:hypothetical protein ADICYQ_1498 [Cyclobacterium qasimii M12-11B]